MVDEGSILGLLGCPLSSFSKELEDSGARGCEDWLRDWLLRKHLELHGKSGDDEKAFAHIRSFFNSTETRELALLVFSACSLSPVNGIDLDEALVEMISNVPQSNRCSLFPMDILKLSQAIATTKTASCLDCELGKEPPSSISPLIKINTFNGLKNESSLLTGQAMVFDSIFDEKISPWITNNSNHTDSDRERYYYDGDVLTDAATLPFSLLEKINKIL